MKKNTYLGMILKFIYEFPALLQKEEEDKSDGEKS